MTFIQRFLENSVLPVAFFLCAAAVLIPLEAFLSEKYPYQYIRVKIPLVRIGEPIIIQADVHRTKLCAYKVERTIHDSKNTRIYYENVTPPTPTKLGAHSFVLPISDYEIAATSPGLAVDRVRIGAMCNPLRRLFPLWGDHITTEFYFVEPKS